MGGGQCGAEHGHRASDTCVAECCLACGIPLATLNIKDFADFAQGEGLTLIARWGRLPAVIGAAIGLASRLAGRTPQGLERVLDLPAVIFLIVPRVPR